MGIKIISQHVLIIKLLFYILLLKDITKLPGDTQK
jgi:hypothetical protein